MTTTYQRSECVSFRKTREAFGGLSNMAAGFPITVRTVKSGRVLCLTSEALYQACRFPSLPDVQRAVIASKSPMTAKMLTKPHRATGTRPDWNEARVVIMYWCLQMKLAQNWDTFGALLRSTGSLPIVEDSFKDAFWGAIPNGPDTLVGQNVLGRLLTGLRDKLTGPDSEKLRYPGLPKVDGLLMYGEQIVCPSAE